MSKQRLIVMLTAVASEGEKMYGWFTLKVSLMALMRIRALLISALLVVMLQMVSTPAMAKQQSGEETTTATTQQGSVSPPPNNNGGDTTPAGGDDNSAKNQSAPLSNGVGLIADPVKDAGDNADTSKSGNTLIHCSPVTGCSQEDLGASIDDGKNSPSNANDDSDASNDGDKSNSSTSSSEKDPILIHCSPTMGCSKEDLGASNDEQSSSTNFNEDSDASKDEQSGSPEAGQAGEVPGKITSTTIENDVSSQQAPTASADTQDNNASNIGEIHGCPFDYDYSDELGTCFPSDSDLGFYPVLGGDKPFPTTLGGGLSFVGNFPGDVLQVLGAGLNTGADSLGDTLVNFGDGGGPIGWGIQGLGYTVGFAGDTVGGLAEGAGAIVDTVADGVGDAIDDIGSALGSLF